MAYLHRESMNSTCLVLCSSLALLTTPAFAQMEFGGEPPSARQELPAPVTTQAMQRVDMLALGARVVQEPTDGPFRFAEVLPAELSIDTHGEWEDLADGDRVWRLRVTSRGAFSLMLTFSSFRLPEGAELFVYDDTREFVRGAYTHLNNKLTGRFAIQPTPGEALTLEYYHPQGAERPELTVSSVVHDYRGVFGYAQLRNGGLGASQSCEVDVACPQGAGWQEQAKAVVRITHPSGICCSGTLVNNTAGDGAAIVLTARHCLDLDDAIFTFNFDRPMCDMGAPPTTDTVMGSTRLASDVDLDFNLVLLSAPPPAAYDVRLAGWDRTDVIPSNTVGIHHPSGDAKKISIDADAPTKSTTFWNIAVWDEGVTEGGSSGSALFAPNGRLVGHLIMGASDCSAPVNDFYGRLAERWDMVAPYLDPLGTAQMTTDTLDPGSLPTPAFNVAGFMSEVFPISPGTRFDEPLSGSGFTAATTIAIDGTPLAAASYLWQGASTLQLDMPLLDIGTHMLTASEGASTQTISFNVATPSEPIFQVGTGDLGQAIFSFVPTPFTYVGGSGDMQLCLFSLSNLPSILPGLVTLEIGNNFMELANCAMITIPSTGHFTVNESLNLQPLTAYFGQTVSLNSGFPVPVSNLQSGVFNF